MVYLVLESFYGALGYISEWRRASGPPLRLHLHYSQAACRH